jgi:hypothetical protein
MGRRHPLMGSELGIVNLFFFSKKIGLFFLILGIPMYFLFIDSPPFCTRNNHLHVARFLLQICSIFSSSNNL